MISIIIPIYNTDNYLHECLDSILSQTYVDWEAILVNDGSLDRSGEICDEYASRDSRFKVIHANHAGLSQSRNIGLVECKGDLIAFADSDDFVHARWLEILYEIHINSDCDISICDYKSFLNENPIINDVFSYSSNNLSAYDVINKMYNYQMSSSVWNKFYTRKIIGDTRFTSCKAEDWDFNLQILLKKDIKAVYADIPLYYYRIRKDALTEGYNQKWLLDDLISHCDIYDHYLTTDKDADYSHVILHRIYRNLLNNKIAVKNDEEMAQYGNLIFEKVLDRTYNDFRNCKALSLLERKSFYLFYYCPPIYQLLLKTKKYFNKKWG